jgi:hypothetical protein
VNIRISKDGAKKAKAKKMQETRNARSVENPRTSSTASLSPFPQYCADRIVVPIMIAAKNRLRTNWICAASDTAERESWSSIPPA